ncbi:hypothetical protein EDD15DRAFT_956365 [Pisolithus albus]|nr:hypothetical protein EDD15DRAFT_956365 [Pisolithus albus]
MQIASKFQLHRDARQTHCIIDRRDLFAAFSTSYLHPSQRIEGVASPQLIMRHFHNTLSYIHAKKTSEDSGWYDEVNVVGAFLKMGIRFRAVAFTGRLRWGGRGGGQPCKTRRNMVCCASCDMTSSFQG